MGVPVKPGTHRPAFPDCCAREVDCLKVLMVSVVVSIRMRKMFVEVRKMFSDAREAEQDVHERQALKLQPEDATFLEWRI